MRDFFIALNRFYSKNKFIIWLILIILIVFKLFSSAMIKNRNDKSGNSSSNNTTTIVADFNNNIANKTDEEIVESISSYEDTIKAFVYFCNNNKIDSAYDMLTDGCKEALYPTKEAFVSDYYNKYFQGYRDITLSKYGNSNGIYQVNFLDDMLASGSTKQGISNMDYITIASKKKIAISGFVNQQKFSKIGSNQYLRVNVLRINNYVDRTEIEVKVDNLTSADIYLDDDESLGATYCIGENNTKYNLDIQRYSGDDLRIEATQSKTITLEFDKPYNFENVSKLLFNNIRIINYQYGDENDRKNQYVPGSDEGVTYNLKTTDYPEKISLTVS